jgi:putative phosphoribosyl transferase
MVTSEEVSIPCSENVVLGGTLTIPDNATTVVVFAHGSGSGRFSPRNRFVAQTLVSKGLGTLLLDLLTPAEEEVDVVTRSLRFDISMLAERLVSVTEWLEKDARTTSLKVSYFGSSTGAAAALIAAAQLGTRISAVVSRGGRPDLADHALPQVVGRTLLIVGGNDFQVIELNQQSYDRLNCDKEMVIVAKATHLFEEPGALEEVAGLAAQWFLKLF